MKKASAVTICFLILIALLAGCDKDVPTPTTSGDLTYEVLVKTATGLPLSEVRVAVYEDAAMSELLCVGMTDEQGSYCFTAQDYGEYVAVLDKVPSAFAVSESYALTGKTTQIDLSVVSLDDESMKSASFVLGDAMMDFTITDCDGNSHTLYDLLQEQDAVVLNFWYLKCDPCRMEFPYLQEAYEACGNNAAFLAMNPVDGNDDTVAAYKVEHGITFSMSACDAQWQDIMKLTAYPTTIVIDRYGYICLLHRGMLTDSAELTHALEYITSEQYQHEIFDSIAEVPSVTVE